MCFSIGQLEARDQEEGDVCMVSEMASEGEEGDGELAPLAPQPATMSETKPRKGRGATIREKYGEDYFQRIGSKGGTSLKEKRGREHYRAIARKGGMTNVNKYGPDHFSEMGKRGGNITKERQDADFYSRIGRMGGSAKHQNRENKNTSVEQ